MNVCSSSAGLRGHRAHSGRGRGFLGPSLGHGAAGGCLRPARGRGQHPGARRCGRLLRARLSHLRAMRPGTQPGRRSRRAKLGAPRSHRARLPLRGRRTCGGRAAPSRLRAQGDEGPAWRPPPASRQGPRGPRPGGSPRAPHARSREAAPRGMRTRPTPPPLAPSPRGDVTVPPTQGAEPRSASAYRSRPRRAVTSSGPGRAGAGPRALPTRARARAARCRHRAPTLGDAIRPRRARGGERPAGRASAGLELRGEGGEAADRGAAGPGGQVAAGAWRTRSLCARCAARPTANARPTTARRGPGPGPSGPAGNDGRSSRPRPGGAARVRLPRPP